MNRNKHPRSWIYIPIMYCFNYESVALGVVGSHKLMYDICSDAVNVEWTVLVKFLRSICLSYI